MPPMSSETEIRIDRLRKIQLLTDSGMDPYPTKAEPTATVADFLASFSSRLEALQPATLAGRVMSLRGQGGIMFADLVDGSTAEKSALAKIQLVFQKDDMDAEPYSLFANTVDVGDFIEVTGVPYTTNRGAQSLKVGSWRMLSKSLLPIPDSWYGLKDEELVLRQRYLDILMNSEIREVFLRKAAFWQTVRTFYLDRGFLEVETPVLESTPGGADARPFETHHHALDIDVSLRISLELWLKRLLVAGYPKVFEIGRIFRNEGQSREHLQDYTQLESYEAFKDMRDGMSFIQDLYRTIAKEVYGKYTFEINDHTIDLADEWQTIDFCAVLRERFAIDALYCTEDEAVQSAKGAGVMFTEAPNKARAIDGLWKLVRKSVAGPAFLVGVPVYLEPLAKRSPQNPDIVERFQVILAGSEMGKGFSELNDPQDQRARFEEQERMREGGDSEAQRLDEDYVRAMEYGMPPSFGFGMSERLFSFLENRSAHETQLFPLLRPKRQDSE
jgi:lysyl-tRNA synthetase, class II